MKVLITGAKGFIGANLQMSLEEQKNVQVATFTRDDDIAQLPALLRTADFIFHLAGINRSQDSTEFITGNLELTQEICKALCVEAEISGKKIPIIYTSSTQATNDQLYGRSKRRAEEALLAAAQSHQIPIHIFRLPNVFGKWCRPNYNSAVATFCHNIARGLPIEVHDPVSPITLVYIDDVIKRFIELLNGANSALGHDGFEIIAPQYSSTVGELARLIQAFGESRATLTTERVGTGLVRALYATYVSYLPREKFSYSVPCYSDPRGTFVEMLRTLDSGQISFFTAHSGVTRGGHYHHTKTEKFLVIKGHARFKFRHMRTGQSHELITTGERPEIVETVPGWTHDITNIGTDEMIVLLWANEVFDRAQPDTFACPV